MLTPEQKKLIYVAFEGSDGEGSAVIFNGVMVYHEDDDDDYSNPNFSAHTVAEQLEKATGLTYLPIQLDKTDLSEEWNFDEVLATAIRKADEQ